MTTTTLPSAVLDVETTRVCKTCGIEKPITDFEQWQKAKGMSWRLRACRQCWSVRQKGYYLKRVVRNLSLYGVKSSPRRLAYDQQLRRRLESGNLATHGRLQSPERYRNKRVYARDTRVTMRGKVLTLYGGKCECCGETDERVLTIDHINGDGAIERRAGIASASLRFYAKLLSLGYPNGRYRLLCMNCNCVIGRFGRCAHTDSSVYLLDVTKNTGRLHRLKLEMIDAYGGCCQICGESHPAFLTIDHINGNGKEHRLVTGIIGGSRFYYWLRRRGWPRDDYRLLCHNCNWRDGLDRIRQNVTDGIA